MFSVGDKLGKIVFELAKSGFLTMRAGLMNEKWYICGRDDLFLFFFLGGSSFDFEWKLVICGPDDLLFLVFIWIMWKIGHPQS